MIKVCRRRAAGDEARMRIRTPFHGDVSQQRCPRSAVAAVLRPHLLGPTDSHFARDEGDTCEVKEADVVEWRRGKVALSFSLFSLLR